MKGKTHFKTFCSNFFSFALIIYRKSEKNTPIDSKKFMKLLKECNLIRPVISEILSFIQKKTFLLYIIG